MHRWLLIVLGLIGCWRAEAQSRVEDLPPEVQAIIREAPQPSDYPNSNTATLYYAKRYELRDDGKITYRLHALRKVLTEEGRNIAEFGIAYSAFYERVQIKIARTILPDGQVVAVRPGDIRDTPVYTGTALYEDTRQKQFVFPQVQVGAVLELEYEVLETPRMPRFFYEQFWLQSAKPMLRATTEVIIGKGWNIRYRVVNSDLKPTHETLPDGRTRYRFQYEWRKEIKPEPYMPPPHRLYGWVEIASEVSWQQVDEWWAQLAKGRDQLPAEVRKRVQAIVKKHKEPIDRLREIYHQVQRRIRYVAVELGQSGYQPHSASQVWNAKYGDCKDMSTLLVGMLREAGIQANWVLIGLNSRQWQPDERWAGPLSFDHCIVRAQIGERVYWLDATGGMLGLGEIPTPLRGAKGLVIGTGGRLETLPGFSLDDPLLDLRLKTRIRPDTSARLQLEMICYHDAALSARQGFRDMGPIELAQLREALPQQFGPKGKTLHLTYSDPNRWDQPFSLKVELEIKDYVYKVGNLILVSLDPRQAIRGAGSPTFNEPTREFPLYFPEGPAYRIRYELTLPEGYEVLAMPERLGVVDDPLVEARVEARQVKGRQLLLHLTFKTRSVTIPKEEYPQFRTRYQESLKRSRQVIVLRRQIK